MENDTFILEAEDGSIECRIITTVYSESRKKHYLIYEYANVPDDAIYVSVYNPTSGDQELEDVTDPEELEEVANLLEKFME